jgi:ELWxxDGT repeat protein
LVNVNGALMFVANDGASGLELWKSDGTTAGTVRVRDIQSGAAGSAPTSLVNVGGTLFFAANDGATGVELWKSDGTEVGTVLVSDIRSGANPSSPTNLANIAGTLFFSANDGTNGRELWKSDGTLVGTVLVKNIRSSSSDSNPSNLTNVSGTLFFSANDGTNGNELWKSDGTTPGTVLVKNIRSSSSGSYPATLANVSGILFFVANDGTHGNELWKSDGTDPGTVLVKDTAAGSVFPAPSQLTNVGGTLYFAANDGAIGNELWKSDGTEIGTAPVMNINPGSLSSTPTNLANIKGSLYFRVSDGVHGVEPWIVRAEASIAGRHLFYNNSFFDGNSGGQDAADNSAIATDKTAYLPGSGTANFSAVSSFARGMTGIMVDLAGGGNHSAISAGDFILKVGNDNSPSAWSLAPTPTVSVVLGGGVGGSDRVKLTWANNAIQDKWLEVQVLATANTGLAAADVHFWGNRRSDSGTSPPATIFETSLTDASQVFANLVGVAAITNLRDYNRSGDVSLSDASTVFTSLGNIARINIGAGGPFAPEGGPAAAALSGTPADAEFVLPSESARSAVVFALTAGPGDSTRPNVSHYWEPRAAFTTAGRAVSQAERDAAHLSPPPKRGPLRSAALAVDLALDEELIDSLLDVSAAARASALFA